VRIRDRSIPILLINRENHPILLLSYPPTSKNSQVPNLGKIRTSKPREIDAGGGNQVNPNRHNNYLGQNVASVMVDTNWNFLYWGAEQ
jgi:hypothetical protein